MSFLARRDPTVKLAVVLGISLLLIFVIDPLTPVLFLALAIAAALAGGAGLGTILRALLPLSILGVGPGRWFYPIVAGAAAFFAVSLHVFSNWDFSRQEEWGREA